MIRRMATAALLLILTATVAGQDSGQRGGWGGPGGHWGPRQWLNQMVEGFDRELGFDEQQWEQLETVVAAQEARAREAQEQWQEVGLAMATGDEARAAELRKKLQQQFDEREGGMQDLFDDIETVLHEDQLVRFREMRGLMQQWRDHGRQMWQAVRELPDAVGMTDEQREGYRGLLRERWQAMQEEMRQRWEEGEGGMQWEAPDFAALQDEFYGQVSGLLDKDQQGRLSDYRLQFVAEGQAAEPQRTEDLRSVLKAMKRVRRLSGEQRDALREIERNALNSYREMRRDKERSAKLAADVKSRIIKVLNPEQTEDFKRSLDRLRPRRGRK